MNSTTSKVLTVCTKAQFTIVYIQFSSAQVVMHSLLVCHLDYTKTTECISTTLGWWMGLSTE